MRLVTENARICCAHVLGLVQLIPAQDLVRIAGQRVMVQTQPLGRPIKGCPNYGPVIKPCLTVVTLATGWSAFVRIAGQSVCLDTLDGLTDGTPPGSVHYRVVDPGQPLLTASA